MLSNTSKYLKILVTVAAGIWIVYMLIAGYGKFRHNFGIEGIRERNAELAEYIELYDSVTSAHDSLVREEYHDLNLVSSVMYFQAILPKSERVTNVSAAMDRLIVRATERQAMFDRLQRRSHDLKAMKVRLDSTVLPPWK